jgi:hypothetical protein
MFKKNELIQFYKDRLMVSLLAVFLVSTLVLLIMTGLNTKITDVQIPIRYSGYGLTNFYRDKWYSLIAFGLFGVVVFTINSYVIVKLRSIRRELSMGLLGLSLFVMLIGTIVSLLVFKLANSSL